MNEVCCKVFRRRRVLAILRRLGQPVKVFTTVRKTGRSRAVRSEMIQEVVVWLEKRFDDKLWLEPVLDFGAFDRFADSVAPKTGGLVTNVLGLVDSIKVEICRPVEE